MAEDTLATPPAAVTTEPPKDKDGKAKHNAENGPKDDHGKPVMHVKVYSPYHLYVDEPVYSISAENVTGPFDILPRHKNFMTLVNACVLDIDTLNGKKKIRINRAVMHVKADEVTVFLDV